MEEANKKVKELIHQLIEVVCNAKENVDEALIAFAKNKGLGNDVIEKINQVLKYLNTFSEKRVQLEEYKDKGHSIEQWFEKELNRMQDRLGKDSKTDIRDVLDKAHSKITELAQL